ncbi:integrator complex subunit 12 [Triplophysa dalaica]|uniref:integrator complex subunit 12 n=1 Tax=Triplophysa dalaica TaxID=1582913 RepID=UPI0024DFC337|nr:integrator complex subunit 12 [Triplophysa dalaica]
MAGTVSLELDPIFLKGLGYLHSKSKDSAEKLKALLDESLSRGSDSVYRTSLKETEVNKVSLPKMTKQDSKSSSSSSSSSIASSSSKSGPSEKTKKEVEKRSLEKVRVEPGDGAEPAKKPRIDRQDSHSSPVAFQTKDVPLPDFPDNDETNADDFAMEMGLACVVCRQMTVTSGNQLVECQECHNLYHQECHKPQATDKDVNDPRLVWYCARCTRQMKRMAQKTQKPPQKPAPPLATAVPMLKDPLVKKAELKPKPETAGSFQAFKRTEVKTSAVSGNSSSSNTSLPPSGGLTGWAAFTKTSNVGPSSTKLGTSQQGGSKSTPPPSGSKAVGLSALANVKPGLATKPTGSGGGGTGNGNNGSSTVPIKPPPPLTLGKQVLSRSSSGDSLGKMTVTGSLSPGAAPSSSLGGNSGSGSNGGGNGGNSSSSSNNNNNGAKASADGKAPTSQESQLNAMKRLQMVKKKAAQKKMKK